MNSRKTRWIGVLAAVLVASILIIYRFFFWSEPPDPTQRVRTIQNPVLPAVFPRNFQFGFATVGYQSEGALRANGSKVASNWSEWEEMGKIDRGQTSDHGCGFLGGYEAELDRAVALGATSFSYAIDWARLEPAPGRFDKAELKRIVAIVKAMRARKLKPLIVLFHWVTPAWVQSPKTGVDLLSRPDRAFVDAFLPVVDYVVPALAPLVDDWVTFEEPWTIVGGGYIEGVHPPGHHLDFAAGKRALVNLMYLNAGVYHRIHKLDTLDADGDGVAAFVGFETIAVDPVPMRLKRAADIDAAARVDYVANRHFINAITKGVVDMDFNIETEKQTDAFKERVPELEHTLDFIGINYYQRIRVEGGGILGPLSPVKGTPHIDTREYDRDAPHSDMYEEIAPDGLRRVIEELAAYKLPLVITENGISDARDDRRPCYLLEHLYTVARAIADGYDVRGYYFWTLSDNFEWNLGVDARYGLFSVDFSKPDLKRTRVRSADLFEAIARTRRIDRTLWDKFTLPAYPIGPL